MRRAFGYIALGLALLMAGCAHLDSSPRPAIYTGPTESMAQVIAAINTNNTRIPTVWSRHYFEATMTDDKQQVHGPFNGEGLLLYQSPNLLKVEGSKPGMDIFEVGCNAEKYWCRIKPEINTFWHGTFEKLDQTEVSRIPIRPDQLIEVLGVGPLDADMLHDPMPQMRFNNDADVYTFVWSTLKSDRMVIIREIWYDRKTKLPKLVILFDSNGRAVLRAYLGKYVPLDQKSPGSSPQMATEFRLWFLDTKTHLKLELTEPRLNKDGKYPNSRTFIFPASPGADKVVDLDATPEKQ